ncbi:insulin-like peptide receptor [Anabrus simplex]|uniref:insulin-like peptide receptor n=1 Tax=Anabrus simplex TaxID=316456 RepID=UPI0035A297F7
MRCLQGVFLFLLLAAAVTLVNAKECRNIDVRNNVADLSKLRGCHAVEGYVRIILMDRATESNYTDVSFPELREITGYLLLYRVKGLRTIGQLFPNLAVIRGYKLFDGCSLVVFEMFQLQDLGLSGLTKIVRGSVMIQRNPNLCFLETINWESITTGALHLSENNNGDVCPFKPKCPPAGCERFICTDNEQCKKIEQDRCDEMCLGGCTGPGPRNCIACKYVLLDGECVRRCPENRFEYQQRRCLTAEECRSFTVLPADAIGDLEYYYPSPGERLCSARCPPNYRESPSLDDCVPCQGRCRKECGDGDVVELDTIEDVQILHGCTHFNGSLVIRLKEDEDVTAELEKSLGSLEEINGSLKVMRASSITSLDFLKSLTVIRGNESDTNKSALVVLNNQNLQQLWNFSGRPTRLRILNGGLFFHHNPRLCLSEIEKLREISGAPNYTNLEVARESNGDKASCEVKNLHTTHVVINSTSVRFEWDNSISEKESLIGYTLHYIESEDLNVTIHDGKDVCDVCNWVVEYIMLTTERANLSKIHFQLSHLKPYSLYSYYVKRYGVAAHQAEGRSEIQHFRTFPDRPSIPRFLKAINNSSSEATLVWEPPLHPHGHITHYIILGRWQPDDREFLSRRDFCRYPLSHDDVDDYIGTTSTAAPNVTTDDEDCCPCVTERRCVSTSQTMNYMYQAETFADENEVCADEDPFYAVFYSTRLFGNGGGIIKIQQEYNLMTITDDNFTSFTFNTSSFELGDTQMSDGTYRPFLLKVDAAHNSTVLKNLSHFAEYTIKLVACRTPYGNLSGDEMYEKCCSPANMVTFRTRKLDSADVINSENVKVENMKNITGSVRIVWPSPLAPNAMVVSYHIEYRRTDIEHSIPKTVCISNLVDTESDRSYELRSLHPGKYALRIRATSLAGEGRFTNFINFIVPDEETSSIFGSRLAVLLSILVIVLIALVILGVFLWRRISQSSRSDVLITTINPEYISLSSYVQDEWEIARDKVELVKELSHGSFGTVYEGILRPANIRCALKTVAEKANAMERIEFLNEASVMKSFSAGHHVVRLLGVVSKGQPPLVVMELMARGDLKNFLRSIREFPQNILDLSRTLRMAAEIADGMAYLEASKFVHRDLAARNCMVAEDLTVKIGDFGMTRDIYETDYYRKGNKGFLPVRWMAPESLEDGVFSSQSDVWSYGVVLWEIATLAEQPYQGLANEQVLHFVLDGGLLERPENCQDILYQLMLACWQIRPANRPNFQQLVGTLEAVADLPEEFRKNSFYHSIVGQQLRESEHIDESGPATRYSSSDENQELQPLTLQEFVDDHVQSRSNSTLPFPPIFKEPSYVNVDRK